MNDNKRVEQRIEAIALFYYGYRDSIVAARTGLTEEEVASIREAWENGEAE